MSIDIPAARLLEQFVVVAEERHFGNAADRLSMSQPPLSQAIQRLERQLGVPLVNRTTRSVTLTAAGEAFARDAANLLSAQRSAIERARRINRGFEGELNVGFVGSLAFKTLPTLLRASQRRFPDLQINLHQHYSVELAELVRIGRLDLALARGPIAVPDQVQMTALATEPMVAALPVGHRLATRSAIKLAELSTERFAMPTTTLLPGMAAQLAVCFQGAGFSPRPGAKSDSAIGLLSHIAAGAHVGVVPEQLREVGFSGVSFHDLDGASGDASMSIVALTESSRASMAVSRVLELLMPE